jgi:osmoprotectant transport system ATP-binding protein
MIRFDAATKRYPDGTVAVDELDLEAPSGKITVLVGPSGCGKTTSLRMINRMIEPTSGRIWLDDTDTASLPAHELRRKIGYVIQHAGLFPHRTIVDNVATVPFLLGTDKKQARVRALELLERVGLDPAFAKRYPAQLSGGQQQRVDPVVRDQLQDEFLRLQDELGKTIVFVTHDIDEAIKLGDQVAVLRVGGTLAQVATPAELLSRPVDAFVAGFVGRDRGYRALGFTNAGTIPTREEPTVRLGSPLPAGEDWLLAVDGSGAPQGWLNLRDEPHGAVVEERMLYRGGTLATQGGTLRSALDACLSSPSGRGVVVDDSGRLLGSTTAREVLALIEALPSAGPSAGPSAVEAPT